MKYILYRELQDFISEHYHRMHKPISFASAMGMTLKAGLIHEGPAAHVSFTDCDLSDLEEISRRIGEMAVPYEASTLELEESTSLLGDLAVFRVPIHSRAGIHAQDGLELYYVHDGTCTLYFEGEEYILRKSEAVIIPPNAEHDIYDLNDAMVFSFLIHQNTFNDTFFQIINTDTALASFYNMCLYQEARVFPRFTIDGPNPFLAAFLAMYSEFSSEKSYRSAICLNYIRILFAYLLRQSHLRFEPETLVNNRQLLNDMPAILRYTRNNYRTVSLNFLADFFHYDRSHLGKQIRKYTGSTFTDLVRTYRMEHALQLLENSRLTIEEIADRTGYNSADHFSRTFRRIYGTAPSVYRKKHLDETAPAYHDRSY